MYDGLPRPSVVSRRLIHDGLGRLVVTYNFPAAKQRQAIAWDASPRKRMEIAIKSQSDGRWNCQRMSSLTCHRLYVVFIVELLV